MHLLPCNMVSMQIHDFFYMWERGHVWQLHLKSIIGDMVSCKFLFSFNNKYESTFPISAHDTILSNFIWCVWFYYVAILWLNKTCSFFIGNKVAQHLYSLPAFFEGICFPIPPSKLDPLNFFSNLKVEKGHAIVILI